VVIAILVINILIFLGSGTPIDEAGRTVRDWGFLFGPAVISGDWWRLVSSGFLHSTTMHIGFNSYVLWILGKQLEPLVGSLRFSLIYLAGLLGGSAAVMLFGFEQSTVGASGAVLGLAGAMMAILKNRGVGFFQTSMGRLVLVNLALPLLIPRISFWGHAGGVAGGYLVVYLMTKLGKADLSDRRAWSSHTVSAGDHTGGIVKAGNTRVVVAVGVSVIVALAAIAIFVPTLLGYSPG